MSKKPDRKSDTSKAKLKKAQARTQRIEKAVIKLTKTHRDIDLDDLEDTVDNID